MDISSKFSLVDFLAYLFPGFVSTLGLYLLLLPTPLNSSLTSLPLDLLTGILILTISYVIGVILSGFAEIGVSFVVKRSSKIWIKDTIPVPGFEEEIIAAFNDIFNGINREEKMQWSATHFHLCRSLIIEFMPSLAQSIQRQSSLRQLRMNLLPSVMIWAIVGITWGIILINANVMIWGYSLVIGSIVLSYPIFSTIINRMNRNEERETREVLTAFLAGYKNGLFKQTKG